jgi:hypothetical protein
VSPGREQLIAVLERAGPDRPEVRQLVKALRRPALRPSQLEELERLIEAVGGPDLAALVVAEALRGGLGG